MPAAGTRREVFCSSAAALAISGGGRFAADRHLPIPVLRDHRAVYGVALLAVATAMAVVVVLVRG